MFWQSSQDLTKQDKSWSAQPREGHVLALARYNNRNSKALSLLPRNSQPKRLQHQATKLPVVASKLECDQAASENGLKILVITADTIKHTPVLQKCADVAHVPMLVLSKGRSEGGDAAEPHSKWQLHSTI